MALREFRLMKLGGGGSFVTVHANHYYSTREFFVFVGEDMREMTRYPRSEFTDVFRVERGEAPPPEGS